jgi:type II secretory ATPase GspE/PulE/Tfp pilus assembly ATPase PilB-like protein
MPNKTIYIRDEDQTLFEKALALKGESTSAVVTRALRQLVAEGEQQQAATAKSARLNDTVDEILRASLGARASTVHLEPTPEGGRVRVRSDGALRTLRTLDPAAFESVSDTLLARMNRSGHDEPTPPHGRLHMEIDGEPRDFSMATLPTLLGRAISLRWMPRGGQLVAPASLDPLGRHRDTLTKLGTSSHGLIVLTGPSGCGKTTTLYSLIGCVDREQRKVVTVEDPAAYTIPNCLQVPLLATTDNSYPNALRGVLRMDPDVVMASEIRDAETARMLVRIALTGHLALTQLHAPTAATALRRLMDLGIEGFLLRDAMAGIVAQRLLRRLCRECREPCAAVPELAAGADTEATWFAPIGCSTCEGTGYRGRVAAYEILLPSPGLRTALAGTPDAETIERIAVEEGMQTLTEDARALTARGHTSAAELRRVMDESASKP